MTPSDPIIPQKVSKWQLRATWNDPVFQSAMLKRCTQRVWVRDELAPPDAEQQPGAMSQIYDLFDHTAGEFLGTFNRYRNEDGSIDARGKESNIWFILD